MQYKPLFSRSWAHMRSSRTIWFLALLNSLTPLISFGSMTSYGVLMELGLQLFVQILCAAGLIWTVSRLEQGEKPGFARAFKAALPYFWRLVGLGLLLNLPTLLVIAPFYACTISGGVIAKFGLLLAYGIVYGFFQVFPTCFLLLKGLTVWQSMKQGFGLIGKNFGSYLELSLLFVLIRVTIMTYSWGFANLVNSGRINLEGTSFYQNLVTQALTPAYQVPNFIFGLILVPLTSIVFTLAFLEYSKNGWGVESSGV
ncbi:MAG TPA: hypothetical protein VFF78_01065 [Anaerolineaceae bacterium]|nr:hypothetical protein [Anaerolineaceae bacterium]